MLSYSGRDARTVNYLKTVNFDYPTWTPCSVAILPAAWIAHRERLEDVVLAHPKIFPGFRKGNVDFDFKKTMRNPLYELGRHTDCWGTIWNNIARGFDSQVEQVPLSDWSAFDEWKQHLPDPMTDAEFGPRPDWDIVARSICDAKATGKLGAWSGLMHGFFFMRLYYLRGFENLMVDLANDDPRIHELSAIVTTYNAAVVRKTLDVGCEYLHLAEDLGMQTSLPISPQMWRKFVKPGYEATAGQARDRSLPVFLHSDGHILEIIDDLVETGITVLNPQFRANSLEGLQEYARGKVCLRQDLDRQLFPFATPSEIMDHVAEVFEGLYLKEGGLMIHAEIGPDVPLRNFDALLSAMEKVCNLPKPSSVN
ncbi:MAG: uroporphyrinogen decarboxylase family protein [Phycisphaerae bacterium]|jgi:hypothetical protein